MELDNCSVCGKVYTKTFRDICPDCFKEEEKAFQIVYAFLRQRKNREATLDEVVEETKVSKDVIIKFIKQKRLRSHNFPNLTYPCESCSTEIREGTLCEDCSKGIKKKMKMFETIDEVYQEREQSEKQAVYYSFKNKKINGKKE